ENDGFELGAQRRAIEKNDLPEALKLIKEFQKAVMSGRDGLKQKPEAKALIVPKEKIAGNGEYNLSGERYLAPEPRGKQKWPMARLGDVCELIRGVTYSKNDEISDGGKKVLRANNINLNGNLDFSDIKRIDKNFDDSKKLKKGDIFICLASGSKDHVGKVAFIESDTEFYFGGFMGCIRTKENLHPKFVFHFLRYSNFNHFLREQIYGTNINNLNKKILYAFQIPLPPLEVQREIAAEIEAYQKVIDGAL
ncbi:MAG: restriction endonuclease subunit S, partial [Treponema sp.]|nr:restriction endonuclease subunit S [Treponema sp.]